MKDTIKLTFDQWHRLGFLIIKGSKGTKTYDPFKLEPYYTFTEDQVIKKKDLEMYVEEKCPWADEVPHY